MTKFLQKNRLLLSLLLFGLLAFWGFDQRFVTKTYSISSSKITQSIRIGLVTDLHSCDYGPNQRDLLKALADSKIDVLLLGGDIIDDVLPQKKALEFLDAVSKIYPTYYVTGNHEYWTGDIESIRDKIRKYTIPILAGDTVTLNIQGQNIRLSGIDDFNEGYLRWTTQLEKCKKEAKASISQNSSLSSSHLPYTLLLSHRPERVKDYMNTSFDLILAGHAHGGQWRLPPFLNGLWVPNQGFFPSYAGGKYTLSPLTTMIVSRGLARETTKFPRIFNPPEFVVIELEPPLKP